MQDSQSLFLRKASGVVRSWSPLDGWVYNVLAINIVVMAALTYLSAIIELPFGSLPLALIIVGIFCTFQAIVYSMLASAMPRSGGDYVFQSRILSGAIGIMFAHTAIVLAGAMWLAIAGWFAAVIITSPFLVLFGNIFDLPVLINAGLWLVTPHGMFIMSLIVIAWAAAVNIIGMRFYALFQRYFFFIGLISLIVVIILMAVSDRSTFMGNFDSFMLSSFGVANAYDAVILSAKEMGYSPVPTSTWSATVAMLPFAAFALIYPAWCAAHAGEIKRGNSIKDQAFQIVGAEVFSFLAAALLAYLIISVFGIEFLAAAGFLYYAEASPLPVPPFYGFFAGVLALNPVILTIIAATFFFWFWMWHPNITLAASRILLAMAFDRVLPAKIGEVNRKTHTPIFAIVVFSLICIVIAWLYSYTGFWRFTLAAALLNISAFGVTCLAGAILPYKQPEIFKMSPASKYKIAGIPLITISGIIFFVFSVWCIYKYLFDPIYGVNDPISLIFIGILYLASLVIYVASKLYRKKREGIDLDLVYKQIPVE